MRLHFPNPSRSYDESSSRILFWGYDRAIEVSFFLETAALKRLCPEMKNVETECLQAFDSVRDRINKVANEVYGRGGGGKGTYAYNLTEEEF